MKRSDNDIGQERREIPYFYRNVTIVALCNRWLRFVMATHFDLSSLRGKITTAYIVLAVSTAVLGIIAVSDLLFLERQVIEGEVVSDLKDAVLEMRREEKNLFLYADFESLYRADDRAAMSIKILQEHQTPLAAVISDSTPQAVAETLNAYRIKLDDWNVAEANDRPSIQKEIRVLGHQVFVSIESLSSNERHVLEMAVRESKWLLLIAIFIIGLSIYLVGRQMSRVVVSPLKQLEDSLKSIADGRFKKLDAPSPDREFVTFTRAFNKMLKELEIRQKRLLQSEKLASLGVLASGVAHELNNPLSNISSSCQLLIEELTLADPVQLNTWLMQIESETERGRKIVRTLLDFGSQSVFQKHQLKLLNIVDEVCIILGTSLQQASAQLVTNIPDDLQLNVDKQRIQQLFINLIQNAVNAGGQGLEINISAIVCDRNMPLISEGAQVAGNLKCINDNEGRFIEILITDNGPGIADEVLSKVFDPFFTTSQPGHGVGLGLSIVQEIVREHDGCLAITSSPGKGTKVIVLLPEQELSNE